MTGPSIAVIGAGYAGLAAALRLSRRGAKRGLQITLITPSDVFVEQIRMQDRTTGAVLPDWPLDALLDGTGIQHLRDRVTAIASEPRPELSFAATPPRAFDRVLLAPGRQYGPASTATRHEFWPIADGPHGAAAAAAHLAALAPNDRVAIIGGGTTGVEIAAGLSEDFPHLEVELASAGRVGAFKGARVETRIRSRLEGRGVTLTDWTRVGPVLSRNGRAEADGLNRPADAVIHCAGGRAPEWLAEAGLPCHSDGSLIADTTLALPGHPGLFAAGDAMTPADPVGAPWRRSAWTALVSGAHAADNILRDLDGRDLRPLGFAWYGQGISLGRRDGIGFLGFPDDRPRGPIYTGRTARWLRDSFVALIRHMVFAQARMPWLLYWFPGRAPRVNHRAGPDRGAA